MIIRMLTFAIQTVQWFLPFRKERNSSFMKHDPLEIQLGRYTLLHSSETHTMIKIELSYRQLSAFNHFPVTQGPPRTSKYHLIWTIYTKSQIKALKCFLPEDLNHNAWCMVCHVQSLCKNSPNSSAMFFALKSFVLNINYSSTQLREN